MKQAFYTVFMAFFELLVNEDKSPTDSTEIMRALKKVNAKLTTHAHHARIEDRTTNIALVKKLIEKSFVSKEPSALRHGPGLALDLENSLRRSRIESARYEFKQGIIDLADKRKENPNIIDMLCEELCSLANAGPHSDSYLYLGVADSTKDAERIKKLDSISPVNVGDVWVVGIEREAKLLGKTVENYVQSLTSRISAAQLSEPLRTGVLASMDTILYKNMTVIRFHIPPQSEPSHYKDEVYGRENSSAKLLKTPQVLALTKLFRNK